MVPTPSWSCSRWASAGTRSPASRTPGSSTEVWAGAWPPPLSASRIYANDMTELVGGLIDGKQCAALGAGLMSALLEVDCLRVRYRNGAIGISDVSLRVEAGQVVAVFGPNGAGKTSTVRGISGFLRTEGARIVHGTVTFDGVDVTNGEPHRQAKRGVAFVPERDKVFPTLTVAENLAALGVAPAPARQQQLMREVFDLFPMLADRRKELAGRLSGGQRQMLALARAILSDPRLLIVDE